MFARSSTWTGSQDEIERWTEHVAKKVGPMVAGIPGSAGAYFFVDRDAGRALTLTLWENEEAALASDATAEQSRESTIAATGIQLVERGRYEVVGRV